MTELCEGLPASLIPVNVKEWYDRNIQMTEAEIKAALVCTQKSDTWMKVRSNRITGSRFAVALGHSYPYSPEKVNSKPVTLANAIREFVWPEPVKGCAVNWGNLNEENARMVSEVIVSKRITEEYGKENIKSITFSYPGTIVCKEAHWVSVSPDGLVKVVFTDPSVPPEDILLEFKCPYTQNDFYSTHGGGIPLYYFDQIQGSMGFLRMDGFNMHRCFFSVWTRERTQISQFLYEKEYFEETMLPWTRAFYFGELLARFLLKSLNLLEPGEVQLMARSDSAARAGPQTTVTYGSGTSTSSTFPSTSSSAPAVPPGVNPYKRKDNFTTFAFPMKKKPALQAAPAK